MNEASSSGAPPAPLLDVRDLSVGFDTREGMIRAVDGVSLTIGRGEVLALVGESGCGKSVTSLALMGLLARPAAHILGGEIRFEERNGAQVDLLTLSPARTRGLRGDEMAMIFQEPMTSLNPVQRVGDQIAEVLVIHRGASRREGRRQALDLLTQVGIPEPAKRIDAFPHELSGGMRQRVVIAIALACRPSLLIADEPTTALDVTIQAQILELLRDLRREIAMAVLFITHDLGVVAELADRVAVMYAGQIVEQGTVREVLKRPRHPYTRGLLGSVPRVDRRGGHLTGIPGSVPDPLALPTGCRFHPRCVAAVSGLCDRGAPELEADGPVHRVRCSRWRDLTRDAA